MATIITGSRILLKQLFDRIRNERLKNNLLQALPFWVASLITGFVALFYAETFALAETVTAAIYHYHAWLLFIISPICFVTSWWLVKRFSPYSRGSGIPQVMAAIELSNPKHDAKIKQLLSFKVIFIKIVSSIIIVIGGGAIGREGPTIQIAGSIFRKTNELLPRWWPKISKKNMIMTGAAAGLAAAFNTPLGGIVFAVEELTKDHISYFKSAIFTAVIIAGLVAQSFLGSYLYIGYPTVTSLSGYVLFGVLLVAVIAGLMGSGMSKIILLIFKWQEKFRAQRQHLLYVIACSLVIASLAFFVNESALGSGKSQLITTLFTHDKYSDWYTPLLRTVSPILTFTTGASGGIFAPGLSAGGSIGSVISGWFRLSDSDTNVMILAGMVAFLTGITRAPFTSAILVLEMTDRNNLILHLMLASIVANIVSILVDKHSLYHHLKNFYKDRLLAEDPMTPAPIEAPVETTG
jgi:H+/Cl- antiporter ClcA